MRITHGKSCERATLLASHDKISQGIWHIQQLPNELVDKYTHAYIIFYTHLHLWNGWSCGAHTISFYTTSPARSLSKCLEVQMYGWYNKKCYLYFFIEIKTECFERNCWNKK